MKINRKLVLINIIIPVVLVALIFFVRHIISIKEIKEDAQNDMVILSDYMASRFEQILIEKVQYLENLSRQSSTVNLYYAAENTFNKDFWNTLPEFIRFTEEFAQGEHFEGDIDETYAAFKGIDPILSNSWLKMPRNFKSNDRPWYIGAIARNSYFISEPYAYANLDNRIIGVTISYPIYRKGVKKGMQQDIVGVVGIDFNMQDINEIARELEEELDIRIGLYDRSSKALYDSNYIEIQKSNSLKTKINELSFQDLYTMADQNVSKEQAARLFSEYKRDKGTLKSIFMGEEILGAHRLLADGYWVLVIYKPTEQVTAKATKDLIYRSVFIGVALVLVLLFSTLFLKFAVVQSITNTSAALKKIAKGNADLTVELKAHSKDEIGQLSISFNTFLSKLKNLILDVQKVIVKTENIEEEISSATAESSSSVEEISSVLNSMGKEVQHLDESIRQTVSSIEEITANIDSMDYQINDQAAMVEESTAAITQMIASLNNVDAITHTKQMATADLANSAEKGRLQVEETSQAFHEMVNYISSIQEMADVINAISSQTDLLSMNAAIEAAHAGDSGKGFAVVAEEIRKLAETSSESSQQISNLVNNINETVIKTDENVKASSEIFKTINKEVKDTINAFSEIQQSIKELNTGGKQVLEASERINNVTAEIRNGSGEIKSGTSIILKSSEDMKNVSTKVNDGMKEVNDGNAEILKAMQHLVKLVAELNSVVTSLKNEFGAFKTS